LNGLNDNRNPSINIGSIEKGNISTSKIAEHMGLSRTTAMCLSLARLGHESLGDSSDAANLMSGLRSTMAGLGTAFYTTLVGAILGSVVLRVMNNVYTSNVDHFVSYIASITEVQITPRLRRSARLPKPEGDNL